MHWNILDEKRKTILPLLKNFSEEGFYLAGGTGLALQMGHRDSIDFDFFKKGDYDTGEMIEKIESVFKDHRIIITQEEKNTVSCVIDGDVRLSFFGYTQEVVKPLIETEYFKIASMEDIACMKLRALAKRAVEKDYVDLYFILKNIPLDDLLDFCEKKFPSFNRILTLKSLSYFDDVQNGDILFKEGHKVSMEEIQKQFGKLIEEYIRQKDMESIRKRKIEKDKGMER